VPLARGPLPSPPPIECTRTSHFLRARPALIPPPRTHAARTLCIRDYAHAARDARAAPRCARTQASRPAISSRPMAHAHDAVGGGGAPAGAAAPRPSPPFTFLDMPCDLLTCLGPVASTPGYEREVDGTQRLCRAARDDAMLGAATAGLRYDQWGGGTRSRLAYACSVNDHARVAWLVECGARDVLAAVAHGYTGGAALVRRLAGDPLVDATAALLAAARVGVADVVALLVARGAQLEGAAYIGGWNPTALRAASRLGHVGVVAALLAAGAAVDAAGDSGMTALMHAADNDKLEVAQALVAAGADVNRRDAGGASAAGRAVFEGREQVAAYLCALPQADPGAHILAAAWLGDVQRVRDFIARGASVEERDVDGDRCLMLAVKRGHVEVVRVLLGAGADVDAADVYRTGVVFSCAVGHPAILAALLARFEVGGVARRQAQLNKAFREAVQLGSPEGEECARMLVAAGAVLPAHMR
jgi:ankyrin repeat protein